MSGNDFWLQAKLGEIIVHEGAIPRTLLFPFTEIAADKFNAHEWLASCMFYGLLSVFGEGGMPFVSAILGLALFTATARLSYIRSGRNFAIGLMGGLLTLLAENYRHDLRPELPSLVLMAIFWNFLDAFRTKPGYLTALGATLIMVVWANLHGSFILGPILAGIYTAGLFLNASIHPYVKQLHPAEPVNQFLSLTLLLFLACLINPFGVGLIQFVISFSNDTFAAQHLTEWIPTLDPRLHSLRGFWIALTVWLLMAIVVLMNIRRLHPIDGILFVAFTLLAVKAIRFPVYLGMVCAYIVSPRVARKWGQRRQQTAALQTITLTATLLLVAALLFGNASNRRPYFYDDPTKFTQKMVHVVSDPALKGNVLNTMELGAELVYRAYPRLRPAIDSRFDSYGTQYHDYMYSLLKSDDLFEAFVQRYDVRYVLMDGSRYNDFTQLNEWKLGKWRVYSMDHKAVLFQRMDIHEGMAFN